MGAVPPRAGALLQPREETADLLPDRRAARHPPPVRADQPDEPVTFIDAAAVMLTGFSHPAHLGPLPVGPWRQEAGGRGQRVQPGAARRIRVDEAVPSSPARGCAARLTVTGDAASACRWGRDPPG